MNALMPLKFADGKTHYIAGGSFIEAPREAFGIKLAREVQMPCDIALDIGDFGVPSETGKILMAAERALECMQADVPVYAGCFAGIGRTGLFLGILAKAIGVDDPLRYVRTYYHPKSIETQEQYDFLVQLDVSKLNARFGVTGVGALHWAHLGAPDSEVQKIEDLGSKWEPMRSFWLEKELNPSFLDFKMWKQARSEKPMDTDALPAVALSVPVGTSDGALVDALEKQGAPKEPVSYRGASSEPLSEEQKPWLQGQKRRV